MTGFFSEEEFKCKCGCGKAYMDLLFVAFLNSLRYEFGRPIVLTSAYRCPEYNSSIGGGAAHPTGKAVDISVRGSEALRLVGLAINKGVMGVGIKQHGDCRFIHLDMLTQEETLSPRPWIWSYK